MPLKSGKGAVTGNIAEMVHKYQATGKIGNTHPKSAAHAHLIAVAAAMSKSKEKHK